MKRRDITLGEMQDECKRKKKCQECDYKEVCPARSGNEEMPERWNLTDPPRFTEAQMAFFRGLHGLGVKKLDKHARNGQPTAFGADGNIFYYDFLDDVEFPLDLAELLGNEKE